MKNIESVCKDKIPPNTTWCKNICSTKNDCMNQHTERKTSQPNDQASKGIQTKRLLSSIYFIFFLASNSLAYINLDAKTRTKFYVYSTILPVRDHLYNEQCPMVKTLQIQQIRMQFYSFLK